MKKLILILLLAVIGLNAQASCPDSTSKDNGTTCFYYSTAISPAPTKLEMTENGVTYTFTSITISTVNGYTAYCINDNTNLTDYDVLKWYGLNPAGNTRVVATCSTSAALPVKFISQSATLSMRYVLIEWSTAMELNNNYFQIEKYTQKGFISIGQVHGNGTTNEISTYEFKDYNVEAINIYRIKQVDYDGQYDYSNMFYVHQKMKPFADPLEGITLIGQKL